MKIIIASLLLVLMLSLLHSIPKQGKKRDLCEENGGITMVLHGYQTCVMK